nr:MAG TPA: hypothetical protein [Caudoviricetes sp.]
MECTQKHRVHFEWNLTADMPKSVTRQALRRIAL